MTSYLPGRPPDVGNAAAAAPASVPPVGTVSRRPAAGPPGRRSRAPGHWSIAHAPAARWADHDERARGRRGAAGPDPRTAQSRSARSGGGSSRRLLPGTGSRPAADVNEAADHARHRPLGMQDSRICVDSVWNRKPARSRAERTDTRAVMTTGPGAAGDQQTHRAQAGTPGGTLSGARLTDIRCPSASPWTTMRSPRRPARTAPAASQTRAAQIPPARSRRPAGPRCRRAPAT